MEWMTTALPNVTTLFTTCLGIITDNPLMALIVTGSCLVPIGFNIFGQAKGAAH